MSDLPPSSPATDTPRESDADLGSQTVRAPVLRRVLLALALIAVISGSAAYTVYAIASIPRCACRLRSRDRNPAAETRARPKVRALGSEETPGAMGGPAQTAGLPRLVDFGSDKCIPCKMMAPVLDALKSEYRGRLDVVFVDVEKDPAAGEKYGVQSIPTQVFYDADGNELYRHEGFYAKSDIVARLRQLSVNLEDKKETENE